MARTKALPKRKETGVGSPGFAVDSAAFSSALRAAFGGVGRGYRIQTGAVDALYDAASEEIDRLLEEASVAAGAEGAVEIDARHVALARRMLCT
jgi:histone H3/H4